MFMRAMLAGAVLLAAAGGAWAAEAVIRGQATPAAYDLKAGTTLEVELLDVSGADAPAESKGSVSVPVKRQGAIPFVLKYDPAAIDAKASYSVAAKLVQDGNVIQRNDATVPVLTQGAGRTASVALVALATPEAAGTSGAADLVGDWTLADLGGQAVAQGVESTLALTDGAEAMGHGGCNNFHGSFTLDGKSFRFGPLGVTRRACPEPQMGQETRFLAALDATRGFRVEEGALLLLDGSDGEIARLTRK